MDQLARSIGEGVRAQTMKTFLTSRMDKDVHARPSPRGDHPGPQPKHPELNPPEKVIPALAAAKPANRKIKDPFIMQQILDKERSKYQRTTEIATSYALGPPPFAPLHQEPMFTLPDARPDPHASYTMSAKDRTDFSHNKYLDNSVNPGGPLTGFVTKERAGYANTYGFRPARLAYEDEVDILAENRDKFQEISHWHSTLEKPNEENLEVLKKINHDRLSNLHSKFKQSKDERDELDRLKHQNVFDTDFIRHSVVESHKRKSSLSANKRAQFGKDFEDYLKRKRNDDARSRGDFDFMVDFDRYECTSPDPKRVYKDHSLLFKENM